VNKVHKKQVKLGVSGHAIVCFEPSLGMQWLDSLIRIVALVHLANSSANATLATISDIFSCLEMSLNNQKIKTIVHHIGH
jgi:hypothetical protein